MALYCSKSDYKAIDEYDYGFSKIGKHIVDYLKQAQFVIETTFFVKNKQN